MSVFADSLYLRETNTEFGFGQAINADGTPSGTPTGVTWGQVTGSPVGVQTKNRGSLLSQVDAGLEKLWVNNSGGTGWIPVGGIAETNSTTGASAAITGTAVETAFSISYTFPANSLTAGSVIRLFGQGIITADAGATTLTIRARIGGVGGALLLQSPAIDTSAGDIWVIGGDVNIRTVGGTGTFVAGGYSAVGGAAVATLRPAFVGSTAIDTTIAQNIVLTAEWGAADANSVRQDIFDTALFYS
jgi:hypothetical protein